MIDQTLEKTCNRLLEQTKHSTHGFWNPDDFKEWGKMALNFIDEIYGVSNQYYTLFLRTHHEALVLGTTDSRFDTYVSVCVAILRSVYSESLKNTEFEQQVTNSSKETQSNLKGILQS